MILLSQNTQKERYILWKKSQCLRSQLLQSMKHLNCLSENAKSKILLIYLLVPMRRKWFISMSLQTRMNVPRRIIVLTYRSLVAYCFRNIPFHGFLNVLCFTARFFLFILTIPALTRIVFHETKKRERTAPPTVRSFSHLMCVPQAVP